MRARSQKSGRGRATSATQRCGLSTRAEIQKWTLRIQTFKNWSDKVLVRLPGVPVIIKSLLVWASSEKCQRRLRAGLSICHRYLTHRFKIEPRVRMPDMNLSISIPTLHTSLQQVRVRAVHLGM